MTESLGNMIGRYQIVSELGSGGMATVYKAFDTRLERHIALKLITNTRQNSELFLKRFKREAVSLAKLSHPNIVKVHDYGESQGHPYIVMEYLPNGTLKKFMGQPLNYQQAAKLLLPVAEALGYAHEQGIVHRDIKPANLLLTEQDIPMISDFGIAKVLAGDTGEQLTQVGTGIGTPAYMSPEQGQGKEIDARTDVYALGVVFYEMITGKKPYEAPTPTGIFWKQMTEPLPDPKLTIPDLPDEVVAFLKKALAVDVNNRVQSMKEFSSSLTQFSKEQAQKSRAEAPMIPVEPITQTIINSSTQSEELSFPQKISTPVLNSQYDSVQNLPPGSPMADKPKKKKTWIIFAVLGSLLVFGGFCVGSIILIANLSENDEPTDIPTTVAVNPQIHEEEEEEASQSSATQTPEMNQEEEAPQPSLTHTPETNQNEAFPEDMKTCIEIAGSGNYPIQDGYIPIFCDTFDTNRNDWFLGNTSNDSIDGNVSMQNGFFHIEMTAKVGWSQYWIWLYNPTVEDNLLAGHFVMEYKIRKAGGTSESFSGVDYQEIDSGEYYSMTVYENSDLLTFEYYDGEAYSTIEEVPLSNWFENDWNHIVITADSPSHSTLANNDLLITDNNLITAPGYLSIWVGVVNSGDSVIYEIDNMIIYRIEN